MPQFDLNNYYSQIFWLIITFGLLYIVAYKFIVPIAEKILNNRQLNVQNNIEQADKLTLEAEGLNKHYNEELTKITNNITLLKKDAIDALNSTFLLKKTRLEQELKQQIQQNFANINIANKEFWANENGEAVNLASSIINKITGKQADANLLINIVKK